MKSAQRSSLAIAVFALALAFALAVAAAWGATSRESRDGYAVIAQGRYLTRAGDCMACHTVDNGQPYAGGRPVPTPFGTIYSTNITPDRDTGIGAWNEDDFYRAMHEGIDRQGRHLYPAFPYPWFTRLSRSDVHAIKAYLGTLPAIRQIDRKPDLPWPVNIRASMAVWNGLYFHAGTYRYDNHESAQWNRGAYLVMGPGHCGACHTAKNFAGAPDADRPLQGGFAENVYAPNLGAGDRDGLGGWTQQDIIDYLGKGANARSTAASAMVEVVEQSTQYLSQADLQAVAIYLKGLRGPKVADIAAPDRDAMRAGQGLYLDNCAACHMNGGAGLPRTFPPLQGSAAVQAAKPDTLIAIVLQGARSPATRALPTGLAMPSFRQRLDDPQVAEVVTYIRNAWGNRGSGVSAATVRDLRKTLAKEEQ